MATLTNPSESEKTKTMAGKRYRVKPQIAAKHPGMTSLVPVDLSKRVGDPNVEVIAVALSGENLTVDVPATATRPAYKRQIKGASQEQLRYLYEIEKNPQIEVVDE